MEERQGAPATANFDTWAGAAAAAPAIRARLSADPPTMPPGGAMPDKDREALLRWLDCELPGQTVPTPEPCASAVSVSGDVHASTTTCDGSSIAIAGTLTVDVSVSLDCLCAVDGDLVLEAAADLPRVSRVGGILRIEGDASEVALPALAHVGGLAIEAPTLTTLELPRLSTVAGSAQIGSIATSTLGLGAIRRIDGDLLVVGSDRVDTIRLDRLEGIGGDLVVADLADLRWIIGTHGLEAVGGGVRFEDLPSLVRLEGWSVLAQIGGPLRVARTGITHLRGFDRMLATPEGVEISENPGLIVFNGLADVTRVGGSLVLRDNDALVGIDSLVFLTSVAGDLVIEDHARLEALPGFVAFEGVQGSVRVVRNPALPTAEVQTFVDGIEVGGTIEITDNGP